MRYTEISLFRASARMRRTWIAMLCEILLLYLSFSLWRCIALAESSASDISRTTLSAFASVPRMRTRGTGGGCYRHSGCPASAFGATIAPNVARPLSSVGTILSALSALAIGVAAPARVQAETDYTRYTLPNAFPGTFDEIEKIVKTGTDPEKHIPPNLERAESGGWDLRMPVTIPGLIGPPGYMPLATGVPGRYGEALGNKESGMAWRLETSGSLDIFLNMSTGFTEWGADTGFHYPDEVCGFTTACRPSDSLRYRDPEINPPVSPRFIPPFLCRHPCQRPLGGLQPPAPGGDPAVDCADHTQITYSCGGGDMVSPADGGLCGGVAGGADGGLAGHLNEKWRYHLFKHEHKDWLQARDADGNLQVDADGNPVMVWSHVGTVFGRGGQCGDPASQRLQNEVQDWIDAGWEVAADMPCCSDTAGAGEGWPSIPSPPNARPCTGQECRKGPDLLNGIASRFWFARTEEAVKQDYENPFPQADNPIRLERREYVSYFRHYPAAGYARAPLTTATTGDPLVPDDDAERANIPVSCYGMYFEYDARWVTVFSEDKNCVIASFYPDDYAFYEMKETQAGKGRYRDEERQGTADADLGLRDSREPHRLWDQDLSGTFSLGESNALGKLENDLSIALFSPDTTVLRPTPQLTEDQPFSSGALLRAFDDTVTNGTPAEGTMTRPAGRDRRTLVEWWQEIQTEMHKRLMPSVVRILLPSPETIDLDLTDPFFTHRIPDPTEPPAGSGTDLSMEPIEARIAATEDLIGEIGGFLERLLLLRTEQTDIPIVIPIGSPTEFRAYAQQWQSWKDFHGASSADLDALIARLEEYAVQAERSRKLRAALASYLGLILERQEESALLIAEWLRTNTARYRQYLLERQFALAVAPVWQYVQDEYRKFHEKVNAPWPRNDRFTTSVFSLLDPWWPATPPTADSLNQPRDITGGIYDDTPSSGALLTDDQELPRLGVWMRDEDVHLDLTAVRPPARPVRLPVLKPIQIRIDTRRIAPPDFILDDPAGVVYPVLPELPPLPDVASTDPALNPFVSFLPAVHTGSLANIVGYPSITDGIAETPDRLVYIYYILWRMTQEYDLFWKSILKPQEDFESEEAKQDCLEPHKDTCVHFEHDLVERFSRIGARPAVFLKDDFESEGHARNAHADTVHDCPREDWVCHALNPLRVRQGGGMYVQDELEAQDQLEAILRRMAVDATLPLDPPPDFVPFPFGAEAKDITPAFRAVAPIELAPPPSVNPNISRP